MDEIMFAAIDRMIESGGQNLARAVVIGKLAKKPADTLLAELEKNGFIRKEGSKFSLTGEGRRAWDGQAGEDRKRELADRPIAAFLAAVQKQGGKALTATQKRQFSDEIVQRVKAEGLVVEAGANKYKLSANGEAFLKTRELEEHLKQLRTNVQHLFQAPHDLLQQIAQDTANLAQGGAARSAIAEARSAIEGEVARAKATFERSLQGIQAIAGLGAVAQTLEKSLPAALAGALERIDVEAERMKQRQADLRQTAEEFWKDLEQARQEIDRRMAAVDEKAQAAKKPVDPVVSTPAPVPSDDVVWQATRRAYEQLEQQFKLTSELIKVPRLTDLVRGEFPALTPAHFHDLLQRWQREDRLVLQVCNDPHFEPRSSEGIPSPRGLLFYIDMK